MNRQTLIERAAALLEEDATAEEESCMVGDKKWTCPDCPKGADGKCQPMRSVEERRKIAAALRLIA